jgi:mycofactocin precursor
MEGTPAPALDDPLESTGSTVSDAPAPAELVVDELLVEEISIDGMCGVY